HPVPAAVGGWRWLGPGGRGGAGRRLAKDPRAARPHLEHARAKPRTELRPTGAPTLRDDHRVAGHHHDGWWYLRGFRRLQIWTWIAGRVRHGHSRGTGGG